MAEDAPFSAALTYDLDSLLAKYESGVEIINGEQYTRFFINPDTGEFFEFSSYPKLFFRWHSAIEHPETHSRLGTRKLLFLRIKTGFIMHYGVLCNSSFCCPFGYVQRTDASRDRFDSNL